MIWAMRKKRIMAIERAVMTKRQSRQWETDATTGKFRSKTELRQKNREKNFECNADDGMKSMKLVCHTKGDVR